MHYCIVKFYGRSQLFEYRHKFLSLINKLLVISYLNLNMCEANVKMKSLLWKEILSLDYAVLKAKDEVIVDAIKKAIFQGGIKWGERLPSYRALAVFAKVDKSFMEKAIKKLRVRDGLIVTIKGRATFVVTKIAYALRKKVVGKTVVRPTRQRRILYNQETLLSSNPLVKTIDICISKGCDEFKVMDSDQRKIKIIPDLIDKSTYLLNHTLPAKYSIEEVHYTQDYTLLINNICEVCLPVKKTFVMIQPAVNMICNAVTGQGKELAFVDADEDGMSIVDLERLCSKVLVGIVYLSSRSIYPYAQRMPSLKIQHLKELQQKHKFIIIEDDRHASFYWNEPNLLMQDFFDYTERLIYLRPLSNFYTELLDFKIVAAPLKISVALKRKFRNGGKGVSAVMAQAINALLDKGVLSKCEPKIHLAIAAVVDKTKQLFEESNLWNMERINMTTGWYLYLEPLYGIFPDNILDHLAAASITVMNGAEFSYSRDEPKVLRISIAAYLDDLHLERDIKVLNDLCRKVIVNC